MKRCKTESISRIGWKRHTRRSNNSKIKDVGKNASKVKCLLAKRLYHANGCSDTNAILLEKLLNAKLASVFAEIL